MQSTSFEHYKIFYYVAKLKNITLAASALFISQPSVSRCISNLEEDLNCKLFLRNKKGVTLTPEGELLFKHIQIACKHIFAAEEEISLYNSTQGGTIRVGVSDATIQPSIIEKIKKFREANPLVKINFNSMSTPDAVEALKSNMIDVAIVTSPLTSKKGLNVKIISQLNDILIAGEKYKDLSHEPISIHQIADYPLITLREGSTTRHYLDYVFRLHNMLVKPDIEVASMNSILPMVQNNLGLGFVTKEFTDEKLKNELVYEIKLKKPLPERSVCIATHAKNPESTIIKSFMSIISSDNQDECSNNPKTI